MKNNDVLRRILFVCVLTIAMQISAAQGCKVEISPEQKRVDGMILGIKPGDTICLLPGVRPEISFINITGSKEKPVIILNKGGKVVIKTKRPFGILFANSVHFRLTGTGGKDTYGIEIAETKTQGVAVGEFSSYAEVDHIDIHHVGFAGIMAKTDPNCKRKDLRPFIMRNLSFHDNLIHETGGEGFYIGYSWFPTRKYTCDGTDTLLFPHEIHGLRIYNNIIRNTGWDGLQVGSSTKDVMIYNNTITNFGVANKMWQDHGVQIGSGTTGDFFNNVVNTGPGGGISFFGAGDNRFYNNILVNTGALAVYQNDGGAVKGKTYEIVNNTIINARGEGFSLNVKNTQNNKIANNLIVVRRGAEGIENLNDRWIASNNQITFDLDEAGFRSKDSLNFALKQDAKAIDAGENIDWLKFDYAFQSRPAGKLFDVGAFEYNAKTKEVPNFPFKEKESKEFVIDPNPVRENYILKMPDLRDTRNISYKIYNGGGLVVKKDIIKNAGDTVSIRTLELRRGIHYILVMLGNDPVQLIRFIKQ